MYEVKKLRSPVCRLRRTMRSEAAEALSPSAEHVSDSSDTYIKPSAHSRALYLFSFWCRHRQNKNRNGDVAGYRFLFGSPVSTSMTLDPNQGLIKKFGNTTWFWVEAVIKWPDDEKPDWCRPGFLYTSPVNWVRFRLLRFSLVSVLLHAYSTSNPNRLRRKSPSFRKSRKKRAFQHRFLGSCISWRWKLEDGN